MIRWIQNLLKKMVHKQPPIVPVPPSSILAASPFLNQLRETPKPAKKSNEEIIAEMDRIDAERGLVKLPVESVVVFNEFSNRHRSMVYRFMLRQIAGAVKSNGAEALLFRMGNSVRVAKIDRSGFKKALMDMINWFIKHEEYEFASKATAVLRSHEVNMMLESSKKD